MGNKLFSVIIPHYNSPQLLERLLKTIPYRNDDVETIVVDDRSDRLTEKLDEVRHLYEKAGVRFFRNNNGIKGPGTCRNIGIRHATGKWLIFADADDRMASDFYDTVSSFKDSSADIIYFEAECIREDGSRGSRDKNTINNVETYINDRNRRNELNLRFRNIEPWAKMVSRKMVADRSILFGETMVSEDVVFSVQCGVAAQSVDASGKVIYIITEAESLTYTKNLQKTRRNITVNNEVFIWMYRYLKKNLSKEDWKLLELNGNMRFIEAYQRNYGFLNLIRMFFRFEFNGIKAVEFKGMSLKTAPATLKGMMATRKRLNSK